MRPVAATAAGEVAAALTAALVAGLAGAAADDSRLADGSGLSGAAGDDSRLAGGSGPARGSRLPDGRVRLLAVASGAAAAAGAILFFFATHRGFLAVTAVLTSLYPAVTIVLARTVLGNG